MIDRRPARSRMRLGAALAGPGTGLSRAQVTNLTIRARQARQAKAAGDALGDIHATPGLKCTPTRSQDADTAPPAYTLAIRTQTTVVKLCAVLPQARSQQHVPGRHRPHRRLLGRFPLMQSSIERLATTDKMDMAPSNRIELGWQILPAFAMCCGCIRVSTFAKTTTRGSCSARTPLSASR